MTLTPKGQIAAVIVGTIGGALLGGKTNRLLGALGGGALGLVVPYVVFGPPAPTASPNLPQNVLWLSPDQIKKAAAGQ